MKSLPTLRRFTQHAMLDLTHPLPDIRTGT